MKFIRRLLRRTFLGRFFRANDRIESIKDVVYISRADIIKAMSIVKNLSVYGGDKKNANFAVILLREANENLKRAEAI